MKRLFAIVAGVLLMVAGVSAKEFDSVFNRFRKLENAEYVKMPGLLVRLGSASMAKSKDMKDLPLEMKLTGMRVLSLEECSEAASKAFDEAVSKAGARCELMLDLVDEGDSATIWLEPKNANQYSKLIIYAKEDRALIEFSGTFKPRAK